MEPVAIVTLVLAGLIIAAAALGLLRVIFHLRAVVKTLDTLIGGVDLIVDKTAAVPVVAPSLNESLAPVRAFAESI
ncbi:MAG TPA: hypothetical protein VLG28_18055 [Acidimicrobiia bacterium]|jgi:hypothetical protein|nr:hypothetical protein [Acidimicrobiia bacterium]